MMVLLICISVLLIANLLTNPLSQNANGNAFSTNCQLNVSDEDNGMACHYS